MRRLALVSLTLAAMAFLAYRHYHHEERVTCTGCGMPVTVLVAKTAIPKGTPANTIAAKPLYVARTIRPNQKVLEQAIIDPSALRGEVAVKRIPAGQQLTAADFGPSSS